MHFITGTPAFQRLGYSSTHSQLQKINQLYNRSRRIEVLGKLKANDSVNPYLILQYFKNIFISPSIEVHIWELYY